MEKFWSLLRSRRFLMSAAGVFAMLFAPMVGVSEGEVTEQLGVVLESGVRLVAAAGIIVGWVHGDSVRVTK